MTRSAGNGRPAVGLLACQGGFEAHRRAFAAIGVATNEVRLPEQIEGLSALVMPGGESTTLAMALERDGLTDPIIELARAGKPVLGTCAGAILLGREHLGLIEISCQRNAYGRQISSFEAPVVIAGAGSEPFRGVFIRAPRIVETGADVEVLASLDGDPVLVRQGNVMAATFHPELAADRRLHAMFSALIGAATAVGTSG